MILLISASQIAKVTGVSHWYVASLIFFYLKKLDFLKKHLPGCGGGGTYL
jgi:hypothetical protein